MWYRGKEKKELAKLYAKAKKQGWADWIRSENDERAMLNGCAFDVEAGERVVRFFRTWLHHSKGQFAGKPFELLSWQYEGVIMPLFGWKRADGGRRFQIGYISVAKKNGKSTLCAGIVLYMLMADGEHGAEVYSAAADHDQAAIVYREAASMVEASVELTMRIKLNRTLKRMTYHKTASFYRALSADAPTKEGLNVSCLIFDELHAQPNRNLWDTLRYGGAARRGPLLLSITTAGYDRNSICYEQYELAKKITDPKADFWDDGFFVYIAEADKDDDWKDEGTWRKANPSFGVTVDEQQFRRDFQEAVDSPSKEMAFRRYRLNQWTDVSSAWLSMDKWDACDGAVDPEALRGRECWAGLDLASTTDVAALSLVFPDKDGGYDVLPYFWIPEEGARARERKDRVPYLQWVREEHIWATRGNVIDYDTIRFFIGLLGEWYDIKEIAIDRWNATQIMTQLEGEGFTVAKFGQGYVSMTSPTKELEKLVISGRLRHGGNPVLRWMAGNTCAEMDAAGNIKPSKKHSTEKIDGIVATIMALGRAMVREDASSVYDERGVIFV